MTEPHAAVYAKISEKLGQLGMSRWNNAIFYLLSHYEGITTLYFEGDYVDPPEEVMNSLASLEQGVDDQALAERLTDLGFVTWRVRDPESGERWDPIHEPLNHFLADHPLPSCWRWEGAYPCRREFMAWLLEHVQAG